MGVEGSEAAPPMRNSRKPRLMLVAGSMKPSRYSSGSRTSMTTSGSPASIRFLTSAGPCSGTTARASASISLSEFIRCSLGEASATGKAPSNSAGSYYHHFRSDPAIPRPGAWRTGQDCYNQPPNESANRRQPRAEVRRMSAPDPIELTDLAKRSLVMQDYGRPPQIDGVALVDLKRFTDDGGSFQELVRLDRGVAAALPGFECRQVNYSEMDPGVVKAFHIHRRQTDVWFVPPGDRMLVVLLDVRAGSKTRDVQMRLVLGDGHSRLLRIPPGVAHGVKNL